MPITIKRWDNGEAIATVDDTDSLREAVIRLVRKGVSLYRADLSGSDLRALAPLITVPSLHRRILAAIENGGQLDMSTWHTCATTHCRAGWAINLAGPGGGVLEACYGPAVAGALIHVASCPQLEGKVPNFYAENDEALEDIQRLAALEPELV